MKIEWEDGDGDFGQAFFSEEGCGAVGLRVKSGVDIAAHRFDDRSEVERIARFLLDAAKKMPRPTKHTFREKMPDGPFWVGNERYSEAATMNGAILIVSAGYRAACSLDTEWEPA